MTAAVKSTLQTLQVPFDFAAMFAASGMTYARFTVTSDIGLSIYASTRANDVVTVTVGGGADGTDYQLTVTAITDAGTFIITRIVSVRGQIPTTQVPPGSITPAPPAPSPAPAPTPAPPAPSPTPAPPAPSPAPAPTPAPPAPTPAPSPAPAPAASFYADNYADNYA